MQLDYEGLFTALNGAGIRYLLTGGVAVNFHGLPRMTYDVDLIVLLERDNLEKLTNLLAGLGYVPRLPVPATDLADPAKQDLEARRASWRSHSCTPASPWPGGRDARRACAI